MLRSLRRPNPATVLSALALFFALGGSAFAVQGGVLGSSGSAAAQPRCADGAIRGIAVVTGDPSKGVGNMSGDFSGDKILFNRRFNCARGAVQVRRAAPGRFEVRFANNGALNAVASPLGTDTLVSAVETVSPGLFRVNLVSVVSNAGRLLVNETSGFVLVAV